MPNEVNDDKQELAYKCLDCGTAVGAEYKFCPNCGAKFVETKIQDPPPNTKGKIKIHKILLFILMLLLGYFVTISGSILLGGKDLDLIVWMIKTNQMKVVWWREILIVYALPSIIINGLLIYGIYWYLFSKRDPY